MSKVANLSLSRRGFLKVSGLAAGGLIVGTSLSGCSSANKPIPYAKDFHPNAFIQITKAGEVVLFIPNAEMGQGITMGLSTLVAEELDMNPASIQTEFAGVHKDYDMPGYGMQITGGSTTIKARYIPLREAAASVRELILEAVAQSLNLPKSELRLQNGKVLHGENKHELTGFIERAKTLPIPKNVVLKKSSEFKWIGKDKTPRVDALAKVTGTAQFGIDVQLPNAKVAVVKSSPVIGGKLVSFDANSIRDMPGVKHIVTVYNGVAVVADSYWQARQVADKLNIQWENTELAGYSTPDVDNALADALENEEGLEAHIDGKGAEALAEVSKTHTAQYKAPYLAHATMEPMNCTVQIKGGPQEERIMEIWIPTQAPGVAAQIASEFTGISRENIQIHTTFLGGGFGRRLGHDYLAQASQIALATGETIKLIWSREDDMQNDYYRPASWANFKAGLDENGNLQSFNVKRAGPNILPYFVDEALGAMLPEALPNGFVDWLSKRPYGIFKNWMADESGLEGLYEDYQVTNKEVRQVTVDPGLRLGFWRSVGHSFSGFFKESFIDELAHETRTDPLEFRLKHLNTNPRLKNVLQLAAEKAGWNSNKQIQPGRYLGLAAHKSFNSYVAEVAEVSVEGNQINVHKVTCVVDCGVAVNPDIVKAQMESGINFGLSAALYQEITLKNGVVEQSNFDDFPMLRMSEAPEINVIIVDSEEAPTGVGEPGLPPIAPAVANAIFAATGKRLRELPLRLG